MEGRVKMICPDCEKGMKFAIALNGNPGDERLILSRSKKFLETNCCPRCHGTGILQYCDGNINNHAEPILGGSPEGDMAQTLVA